MTKLGEDSGLLRVVLRTAAHQYTMIHQVSSNLYFHVSLHVHVSLCILNDMLYTYVMVPSARAHGRITRELSILLPGCISIRSSVNCVIVCVPETQSRGFERVLLRITNAL